MKKALRISLFLSVMILISAFTFSVSADGSGVCGQDASWVLDSEGMLTISGKGNMTDWQTDTDVPWHLQREDIINVKVEDGILSIGNNAFNGCKNLMNINLPDGITSIGEDAFKNCSDLFVISIPDSVKVIETRAFFGCLTLTKIDFGHGVESIKDLAFDECASLESISLPASLKSIGDHAFRNCNSLSYACFEEGLTSIGAYAFYELKNLERAVLPKSLSSVGEYAFDSCPMLVICGYSDTFSQKFAKENELEFLVIYDLPYTDVSLTDWFYQGAAFMYNNKLVAENDSKLFDPEKELTYADAVKLACAVYQLDRNINPSDNASYMAYALEIGIIQVDLSAKADNAISREDFVDILYNAMPKEKYGEINKLDGGAIPDVKDNEKILTFYRAGILTGCDNSGVFNPKSNIKRSEAATIIARMLDNAAKQKFELG